MKVSVIIPALNEAAFITGAARSAWKASADEVVVVDGGSVDETISVAQAEGCQVVVSAPGRAIQQNAGANRATGDLLLFLHADNRLGPATIEQARELLQDERITFGAYRQHIDAQGLAYRWLERGNAWRVCWRGTPYGDQAIFMRREFFESLGGFPEVKLMEDLLLMRKAKRHSWPRLLDGPVHVDARRWQRHGVIRQTLRNWTLLAAHQLGCAPDSLANFYRRHDTAS
ncbi:MAG: TIGR04283 family arsenosugar biosynthesis glycosyltransferase [Planctomycetia bacterium]|nr:TIGR04283 family arsenosugar biosynthesis glycosyltransferase [Planctomycetia bacterium]